MYRLETKKDLIAAADVLDQLCGPDPKAATRDTTEASTRTEALDVATAGPGLPWKCGICMEYLPNHSSDCTVGTMECTIPKMNADIDESRRVAMADAEPLQVILRMEDSPYQS